jgi:uncharacterized protein (TIGR02145 family)
VINFVQLNHKKDKDMIKLKELVIIISSMVIMSAQMNGQNVGIGANMFTPDNSALLELQSTNRGLLLPRMTTAQRDAISNPAQSLLIFNTTTKCFETYVGNVWRAVWCDFTCGTSTVTYDGFTYNTVQIGNQCWLKENLRTTKYNDGTSITNVTDNATWTSTTSGAYCCYSNSTSNCTTYGALYNWYAVTTGKLCPSGWHVPSDAEWKTLEMYLGMTQAQADATGWRGTDQGSKLAGSANLWTDGVLDQNANFGTSGFSALPGGYRDYSGGSFYGLGYDGYWWSSTEYGGSDAWYRYLYYYNANVGRYNDYKRNGFSVRCLRD